MGNRADDSETRRAWRLNWLSSIHEVSDIETQRRMWLDSTNTNPHWSFIEYCCGYFDDCALDDAVGGYSAALKNAWVTLDEVAAVARWHNSFQKYKPPMKNDRNNEAILNDPKWLEVVREARRARDSLSLLLSDPQELAVLAP